MRIYLATWLVDRTTGTTLTKVGGNRRLLSYYFLNSQDIPQEGFEEYCRTGEYDIRKKEDAGAIFSQGKKHRYVLWRIWDKNKGMVMFVGLNPSIADANEDDPTIRRVKSFAKSWGYGGIYMLNLFTYIATDPQDLKQSSNPNSCAVEYFIEYLHKSDMIVFAWGSNKLAKEQESKFFRHCPYAYVLGFNEDGSPKHPLYVKGDTKLIQIIPYK